MSIKRAPITLIEKSGRIVAELDDRHVVVKNYAHVIHISTFFLLRPVTEYLISGKKTYNLGK